MFYSNPTYCNLLTIDILKQKLCLVLQQALCSRRTLASNIGLMIWTRICLAYSNIIKILLLFTHRENKKYKTFSTLCTDCCLLSSRHFLCKQLQLLPAIGGLESNVSKYLINTVQVKYSFLILTLQYEISLSFFTVFLDLH